MKKLLLLIVIVAGAAAAWYFTMGKAAFDHQAQEDTVADIRNTGQAWFSWLTDQVGQVEPPESPLMQVKTYYASFLGPVKSKRAYLSKDTVKGTPEYANSADPMAPKTTFTVEGKSFTLTKHTARQLFGALHPSDTMFYAEKVPYKDGWGHDLEFYLAENLLASNVLLIRSTGRDGQFSGTTYAAEGFDPENYDEDIVWMDGYFVRFPKKPADE